MPRKLPQFDLALEAKARVACKVVLTGENSALHRVKSGLNWTPARLEYLYEFAYLRVFATWESILENIFLRSLCGFYGSKGQEQLVCGKYYRSIIDAEKAALSGQPFMLWHSTAKVIGRLQKHIRSGVGCPALQETVISSNQARLDALSAIRHRVVHDQSDASLKFKKATLMLFGKTFERPGRFLRAMDTTVSPPRPWLDSLIVEFIGLTAQMI